MLDFDEEKIDGDNTNILAAVFNKSWKQQLSKLHVDGYLPPISQITQVIQARHAWQKWGRKDKYIRDIFFFVAYCTAEKTTNN